MAKTKWRAFLIFCSENFFGGSDSEKKCAFWGSESDYFNLNANFFLKGDIKKSSPFGFSPKSVLTFAKKNLTPS